MIFEPEKPCRVTPTRGCPMLRPAGCEGHPCARYESDDETPWAMDVEIWKAEYWMAMIWDGHPATRPPRP